MYDQPPHIFLAIDAESVLAIKHGERQMIRNEPPNSPPQPANDEPRDTHLSALLKCQAWKSNITLEQQGNIPFSRRQQLHELWKEADAIEAKMIAKLFK